MNWIYKAEMIEFQQNPCRLPMVCSDDGYVHLTRKFINANIRHGPGQMTVCHHTFDVQGFQDDGPKSRGSSLNGTVRLATQRTFSGMILSILKVEFPC